MIRCDVCGKFRKDKDVIGCAGDSNDGFYDEWIECINCCSGFDKARLLKARELEDKHNDR